MEDLTNIYLQTARLADAAERQNDILERIAGNLERLVDSMPANPEGCLEVITHQASPWRG